jgi:death on curing protein
MDQVCFLLIDEVIKINADQIALYGGLHGVRDFALLDSAINRAKASFQGTYLYGDIFIMAAAYAHSIIKNHPFVDGNKRTGIVSALLFLGCNGYKPTLNDDQLIEIAMNVATSNMSLNELATYLKSHTLDA